MENRTVIAVVLTILLLILWQYFMPAKAPSPAGGLKPSSQGQNQAGPAEGTGKGPATPGQQVQGVLPSTAPAPAVERKAKKLIVVETPKLRVTLSDLGGGLTSVRLKEYRETVGGTANKELLENPSPYSYMPAVFQSASGQTADDATIFTSDRTGVVVKDRPETLTFSGALTDGTKLQKTYTFYPDTYTIGLAMQAQGSAQAITYADCAVMSIEAKSRYIFKGPFLYDGTSFNQINKLDSPVNAGTAYSYTGFDEGYFSFIFAPKGAAKPDLLITKSGNTPIDRFIFRNGRMESLLYFVPNKVSILKTLNINAEKIVNFGWFDIIAKPMLWGMNYSDKFTHNYGIDIILLTVLIKIIFYPLSVKSYKSMKQMQKMQPVIAKLREKYKDDKEKLNKEMMEIYKGKGINPLGGCLPMVIQIPVFFALYRVLMGAIEFRHAPFMLWIHDLAAPENLYTLNVAGYSLPLRVLPLIMGITMVIQQKMQPTSVDPMQEKMMLFMPVVFTFLFWGFPTGLVLYWLINNVISIGQQYYINKQVA
ncbi:MAG TPA: membrane protein insertase YidC [Syntrophorhabdales bacterium]|nr:membrane protein insertase YidC [Syntrophorhabdales bacterium]